MAAIAITYALLAVLELCARARRRGIALANHVAPSRPRSGHSGPYSACRITTDPHPFHVNLLTFVLFEAVFVCICAAYLFGGLAKDRIAASYQRASLIDPLTGVANRRGFLRRRTADGPNSFCAPTARALLFDLDRFKSINDKFGHHAGDAVISAFCQSATSLLRPTDLFGGSEVRSSRACYRIRAARCPRAGRAVTYRVRSHPPQGRRATAYRDSQRWRRNLGRCELRSRRPPDAADQALYRAKAMGRNRIELSTHSPQSPSAQQASGQAAA